MAQRQQDVGQAPALEILRNKRIVGDLDAELHGQEKRSRRLAGAGNTNENDFGLIQAAVRLTVVVRERIVDGGNALVVAFFVANLVRGADRVLAFHVQFLLERTDERAEEFDLKTFVAVDESAGNHRINEGGEHQRTHARAVQRCIDSFGRLRGLFDRVDKRNAFAVVVEVRKLSEHGVRKRFSRDGRAVAHNENGAPVGVSGRIGLLIFRHRCVFAKK